MKRLPIVALLALLALQMACVAPGKEPRTIIRRVVPPNANGPVQTWWADNRLREDGVYRNGQRHGHVRGFHPDGSLAFEGDFEDGVSVGEIEHHYPGGKLAVRATMEGGTMQGPRREYFPGGALAVESNYVDGVREGTETRWHENGVKSDEGRYEQGHPSGHWTNWDESGRLAGERWYWLAGGQPAGHLESVFGRNGRISVQTRLLIVDGEWRSRVTFWHPNGRRAGLVETVNGARHGLDQSWDAEGRKRHEGRHEDDQRHGAWTWWGPSGDVIRAVVYEHGVPEGAPAPSG